MVCVGNIRHPMYRELKTSINNCFSSYYDSEIIPSERLIKEYLTFNPNLKSTIRFFVDIDLSPFKDNLHDWRWFRMC